MHEDNLLPDRRFHPEVIPYLNSNAELDTRVYNLLAVAKETPIDMKKAHQLFLEASAMSSKLGNIIGSLKFLVPHCFEVSKRSEESAQMVAEHYPGVIVDPLQYAFAGLIEDSFYLFAGNGNTSPNGIDGGAVHEMLLYLQLQHMGLPEYAEGCALHFTSPQMLGALHQQGEFQDIPLPEDDNLMLTILTGVDALCDGGDWVPHQYNGSLHDAAKARVEDVIKRRKEISLDHPVVVSYENGGKERLERAVDRLDQLRRGILPPEEVQRLAAL